jgi:hypothetical protein
VGRSSKLTDGQVAQAGARYLAGERVADLADELAVGEETLRRAFRRAEISRRKRPTAADLEHALDPDAFRDLGEPPLDDALGAAEWMYKVLARSALQALKDPAYVGTETMRRKELREIASAMGRLQPITALYDARRLITTDSAELEKTQVGPTTESRASRQRN